jgi:hypothetical protein
MTFQPILNFGVLLTMTSNFYSCDNISRRGALPLVAKDGAPAAFPDLRKELSCGTPFDKVAKPSGVAIEDYSRFLAGRVVPFRVSS